MNIRYFRRIVLLTFYLLAFAVSVYSVEAVSKEITIFDKQGDAAAYFDTENEGVIYLWSGRPVAYLFTNSVYGFNGKHLGWIEQGIFYDRDGYGVGFFEYATTLLTHIQPLKGLKMLQPVKSLKELEPLRPLFSSYWTNTPLEVFFLNGTN